VDFAISYCHRYRPWTCTTRGDGEKRITSGRCRCRWRRKSAQHDDEFIRRKVLSSIIPTGARPYLARFPPCLLFSSLFTNPSQSSSLTHPVLHPRCQTSLIMGQSRSYHGTLSSPFHLHQVLQANPQLHPTPIFSRITVYGGYGEAVQLCVRLSVFTFPHAPRA
jgi:hypothetical protein